MFPDFIPLNIAVVAYPIKRGLITENSVDRIPQITVKLTFNLYPASKLNMFLMDCLVFAGFSGGSLLGFLAIYLPPVAFLIGRVSMMKLDSSSSYIKSLERSIWEDTISL